MNEKILFFETHPEDGNKSEYPNISVNSIISFRESNNGYNAEVKIKKSGWITIKISFEKFKGFVFLQN